MNKIKVLIIGKNSFIGSNLYTYLKKKYFVKKLSFNKKILKSLKNYDVVINCSINKKYIKYKYDKKNDFDFKIIKEITDSKTRFIFLSTRKIYFPKSNIRENSNKKFLDTYGKNKFITEKKVQQYHGNKSTILRISNLIGFKKKNIKKVHSTYLDELLKMVKKGKIIDNKKKFKDFLGIKIFSKIIHLVIKKKILGIYNVSMGEKIYLNEINKWILKYYKKKNTLKVIKYKNDNKNESFYLNNYKLKKNINLKINKKSLKKECLKLSKKLFNRNQ